MNPEQFFEKYFELLTVRVPYPWQKKLFTEIVGGRWPQIVNMPTGAGKTAVLHIWLLALCWALKTKTGCIPRRLAWVVNRRVVVDQVTDEVEELVQAGGGLDRCPELRDLLAAASSSGVALAVSTLRGQRADTGDWSRDPTTPAVVIGTVDMIGSRLLFRGYRSGRYYRPMHAGLLGVDTLIVNDEAHLSPAFAFLLEQIHRMAPASRVSGKSFRVMLLSATQGDSGLRPLEHTPDEDAIESESFRRVYQAVKTLQLHEVETKSLESTMWSLATQNPKGRTVLFIERPEKAASFCARLAKDGRKVALLTGTMRGFERDGLVKNNLTFGQFLQREPSNEPVWLVSTSAGEVGINMTCERMITELVEADHLLQRFGRLNRFGIGQGEAHVVYAPTRKDQLILTLAYLRTLDGNISCHNLWEHKPGKEACAENQAVARLEQRLIEIWAQTTYWDKFIPAVEPWLHGKQDNEVPDTELAWRADIEILSNWGISDTQIEQVVERYPVRPEERLREPTPRVQEKLREMASHSTETAKMVLLIVNLDGSVRKVRVEQAVKDVSIAGKLLLMPEKFGTLQHGMFRAEPAGEDVVCDVADRERKRRRYRIADSIWTRIGEPEETVQREADRNSLAGFAREEGLRAPVVIRHPVNENEMLVYFPESQAGRAKPRDVLLRDHRTAVKEKAGALAIRAGLDGIATVFSRAGVLHDDGKRHEIWQRAMGGSMDEPIAKSRAPVNIKLINGYRHELGSLLKTGEECDDLLLHLIASHHAGARPYFETRQFDRDALKTSQTVALESARRFARLQKEWGPWGLAYLEAIFKCADGIVSAEEGEGASG